MNKFIFPVASAIALWLVTMSPTAAAETGIFVSVNGGTTQYDIPHSSGFDTSDRAFGGLVGWRWIVDRPFAFGVEAGYVDLGKVTSSATTHYDVARRGDRGIDVELDEKYVGKGVLAGLNAKWNFPGKTTITARLGAVNVRTTQSEKGSVTYAGYTDSYRRSDVNYSDTGMYGGIGFGFDINRHFGVLFTYDHYRFKASFATDNHSSEERNVDVGVFGMAAEVRF